MYILVVDDDPDITLTFKVGLEDDKSFEVYTYTDPLEALSRFRPHFYDLLLVDINMPKMNGFELYKKIKDIENKKSKEKKEETRRSRREMNQPKYI